MDVKNQDDLRNFNQTLAEKTADSLLTNGFHEKGVRLIISNTEQQYLGGWGKQALVNIILQVIVDTQNRERARVKTVLDFLKEYD